MVYRNFERQPTSKRLHTILHDKSRSYVYLAHARLRYLRTTGFLAYERGRVVRGCWPPANG